MTEYTLLDVPSLIEPISEEAPTGENLREDASPLSIYYELKDVRAQARNNERKELENGILERDDDEWKPILKKAPEVLATRTKDLEVAAWLIEAAVRSTGFRGLKEAFELTRELIDRYWGNIYPPEDEDGVETKIAPIVGLNGYGTEGALIMPIKCVPITYGRDFGPFATWQYFKAYENEKITDPEKRDELSEDGLTLDKLRASAAQTSDADLRKLKVDLDECIDEYKKLSDSIDRVCASNPQPTSNIRDALIECRDALVDLAGDSLEDPVEEEIAEDVDSAESEGDSNNGASSAGSVRVLNKKVDGRKEALASLKEIADFFRKTEPHSPISYALEQAIRWSNMSLPQLMEELVSDHDTRDNFFRLTGIRTSEEQPE